MPSMRFLTRLPSARHVATSLLFMLSAGATGSLAAQTTTADGTTQGATRAAFCFRGGALPHCRAFLLTEAAYYRRAAGTARTYPDGSVTTPLRDLDGHVSWEIGYMRNIAARNAVGGTVLAGTGDAGARVALRARHRQWLGEPAGARNGTVDLSFGVLTAGVRHPAAADPRNPGPGYSLVHRGVGISADVTLGVGDLVGISVRGEVLRANRQKSAAVFGGVRLGSYPAILASTLGALGLVLLAGSISS